MWSHGAFNRSNMKCFVVGVSQFIIDVVIEVVKKWGNEPENWPSFNKLLYKINERDYKNMIEVHSIKNLTDLKGLAGSDGLTPTPPHIPSNSRYQRLSN